MILDDSEKSAGHRKFRVAMGYFRNVIDEMVLVDTKPDRGWFMWTNNRKGYGFIRERLDRFFISSSWLQVVSFMVMGVICRANYNHDLIMLDTLGTRSKECKRDPRLSFRYKECWTKVDDAKGVINETWDNC